MTGRRPESHTHVQDEFVDMVLDALEITRAEYDARIEEAEQVANSTIHMVEDLAQRMMAAILSGGEPRFAVVLHVQWPEGQWAPRPTGDAGGVDELTRPTEPQVSFQHTFEDRSLLPPFLREMADFAARMDDPTSYAYRHGRYSHDIDGHYSPEGSSVDDS